MKPNAQPRDTFELFQSHFDQLLNPSHELILLAKKIDWSSMEAAFVDTYCPVYGAPAKAVRLMVVWLPKTLSESKTLFWTL